MIKLNKYVLFIAFVCSLFLTGIYLNKFLNLDFELYSFKELFIKSMGLQGSALTSLVLLMAVKKRKEEIFNTGKN